MAKSLFEPKLDVRECPGCGVNGQMRQYLPSGEQMSDGPCMICEGGKRVRVGKAEDVLKVSRAR